MWFCSMSLSYWMALLLLASQNVGDAGVMGALFVPGLHQPHAFQSSDKLRGQESSTIPPIRSAQSRLYSTPYEASFSDDDDENFIRNNPFEAPLSQKGPLAVSEDTKLVIGLNKYSHDTTLCAADAATGEVLFAVSKERLTRKKHDGGNAASLVETCLDCLDLDLSSVERVVVNNHHHRVLPMERDQDHIEWESGQGINGGAEPGYEDEENLLNSVPSKLELSHHLAHAYSAAAQCPFDRGLIVVMDGMGETYRTMLNAKMNNDEDYTSDLSFESSFQCIPSDLAERSRYSNFDWREGESVYTFQKEADGKGLSLKPIFKRFVEEKTPPTLYNHGFENMESAGAVYSRASSHIFGDWNACGKVMGLAPWMGHVWKGQITAPMLEDKIMTGTLYSEEEDKLFEINRRAISGTPHVARNDPDMFNDEGEMVRKRKYDFDDNEEEEEDMPVAARVDDGLMDLDDDVVTKKKKQLPTSVALDAISLAYRIQIDLEEVVMDFVRHFKETSGESNMCLAGGVGLNSVLNGRLHRELGFEKVFIPPYPGDDGIAVGCCAFGLFENKELPKKRISSSSSPNLWKEPLSPYLGPMPTDMDIKAAIEEAEPWLEVETVRDNQRRFDMMARELESGGVVAWYHGRSELGPRALGHRSILADPRKKGLVRFINEDVKRRESFRPFAPSVLVEEASDWFELGDIALRDPNVSPYMTLTAQVKDSKRSEIPAVTHVDGSSRLQTVKKEAEPLYHQLISTFFKLTGVPMVLNTSFNTLPSEPIVETPSNAIRSFMCSMGSIEMLVMGDYIIKRKQANIRRLLGEGDDNKVLTKPINPRIAGPVTFESSLTLQGNINKDTVSAMPTTRIRMPARPMHSDKGNDWFELLDELEAEILSACDGTVSVQDLMNGFLESNEGDLPDEEYSEFSNGLLQNIINRLVRLYEQSFISW
uniref:Carbamoyltransferase n=1 Tax=Attheya septentrionalis TaxID=420275 RepID=A0A7S2XJY0_9STRA|mmetsp:Transcript_13201/g.23948  ORF Transcript_13201/g.23948 Transcript_13201/m.23948 type:complete len:935 (+) Transcript_13201:179-2983(+)